MYYKCFVEKFPALNEAPAVNAALKESANVKSIYLYLWKAVLKCMK